MGRKLKSFIFSFILFWIIDIPSAILAAERTLFEGMYGVAPAALIFSVILFFTLNSGFKAVESRDKKKVLWKMPLMTFITCIILSILIEIILVVQVFIFKLCEEFGCATPILWPLVGLSISLGCAVIAFLISLIFYFVYKNK